MLTPPSPPGEQPPGEHPDAKTCFACLSEIPAEAEVCRACGTRVEGIQCQECLSFCPEQARKCQWCGSALIHRHQGLVLPQTLVIQADPVASLLLEWSFTPQRVVVESDKLAITTFALFGLTSHSEEMPWEKVAGFSHHSGLFWDSIAIETRGQTAARIGCLRKRDARRIKQVLQSLER